MLQLAGIFGLGNGFPQELQENLHIPALVEQQAAQFIHEKWNRFHALQSQIQRAYGGCAKAMVQAAIQAQRLAGIGSRSRAYRIPKMGDYVLQIPQGLATMDLPEILILKPEVDPTPGLNIGQAVASLAEGKLRILQAQAGVHAGIPFASFFEKYGIDELLGYGLPMRVEDTAPYRKAYARHLARVATMPQQAYDQLARRVIQLRMNGLHLDPCSLNLLVDVRNRAFNTVDHLECIGPYENVLGLACALMDTMYVDLDAHALYVDGRPTERTVASEPRLVGLRGMILEKLLLAALRTGLPLPEGPCPVNRFGFRQRSFDMAFVLEIAGMAGEWPQWQALFENTDRLSSVETGLRDKQVA